MTTQTTLEELKEIMEDAQNDFSHACRAADHAAAYCKSTVSHHRENRAMLSNELGEAEHNYNEALEESKWD